MIDSTQRPEPRSGTAAARQSLLVSFQKRRRWFDSSLFYLHRWGKRGRRRFDFGCWSPAVRQFRGGRHGSQFGGRGGQVLGHALFLDLLRHGEVKSGWPANRLKNDKGAALRCRCVSAERELAWLARAGESRLRYRCRRGCAWVSAVRRRKLDSRL